MQISLWRHVASPALRDEGSPESGAGELALGLCGWGRWNRMLWNYSHVNADVFFPLHDGVGEFGLKLLLVFNQLL